MLGGKKILIEFNLSEPSKILLPKLMNASVAVVSTVGPSLHVIEHYMIVCM